MFTYFYESIVITTFCLFFIDTIIRYFGYKNNHNLSLITHIISCLNNDYKLIYTNKIFMQRFFLLLFCIILIFISNIFCLSIFLSKQQISYFVLFLCLIFNYTHILFYTISYNYIRINSGLVLFRERILLSLSFISIIYLLEFINNTIIYAIYYLLILFILSYLLMLNSRICLHHKNNFSLITHEFSFSFTKLYYKLFSYLEIIFYAIIILNKLDFNKFTQKDLSILIIKIISLVIISYIYNKLINNYYYIFINNILKNKLVILVFILLGFDQLLQTI